MNHYEVLGVSKNASDDVIKKQYHDLAKKYHPDKSSSPSALENFNKVKEAWHVLSCPQLRKDYNEKLLRDQVIFYSVLYC